MTAETAPHQEEAEKTADADVILPEPTPIVVGDIKCEVRRLKTREFLALMKVLLRGVGSGLIGVFQEEDEQVMMGRLTGAILVAIPEAEDEFIEFVKKIVVAQDGRQQKKLSEYLDNPEIDEMMEIARVIIENEAQDFARLGKDARAWWGTMRQTFRPEGGQSTD